MKTQVKSGEIPIHKKVGKMKQNVDSCRLTPNLTCYPILKIQSRENTRKDLKISKTGMADRWVLVQVKKSINWTPWIKDFTRSTFRTFDFLDRQDLGPATWAHINGYIDTCECAKIFIQQFLKVENQTD